MTDFRKCKYYDGRPSSPGITIGDCRHPARKGYRFSYEYGERLACERRCPMTCSEISRGFRDCPLWASKGSNILEIPKGGAP